jgi:hypothetical protein
MAYVLQAVIAENSVSEKQCFAGYPLVKLPQNMIMLPVTSVLCDDLGFPKWSLADEDDPQDLPDEIAAFCASLCETGCLVYVEAEFFGGDGTQFCALFENCKLVEPAITDPKAINHALQFLGVTVGDNYDEFAALGLGKHRFTDEWLES